jgi:hypothetical protein
MKTAANHDFIQQALKAFPQIQKIEIKPDQMLRKIFVLTDCQEPDGLLDFVRMHSSMAWRIEWKPIAQ